MADIIGMILAGFLFTKLGIWAVKKVGFDPLQAAYRSIVFTSLFVCFLGHYSYGVLNSFLMYVPMICFFHWLAIRKLQKQVALKQSSL